MIHFYYYYYYYIICIISIITILSDIQLTREPTIENEAYLPHIIINNQEIAFCSLTVKIKYKIYIEFDYIFI